MAPLPHAKPFLDGNDYAAVDAVMRSGMIATGPSIAEFEAKIAGIVGARQAVATSSGFAALHLALLGLGVGSGDEVIVPAVSTCTALLNAIYAVNAKPVLADISPDDANLSPADVEQKISPATKAIIAPHHFGIPSELDQLVSFGVPVVEDCAQAMGATFKGKPVGSWGMCAVFSFYATKLMTAIDGGMVVSNSERLMSEVRDLRYYAGNKEFRPRFNYKMQNLQAALGLSQLQKLARLLGTRRRFAEQYTNGLQNQDEIEPLTYDTSDKHGVYYYYYCRSDAENVSRLLRELNRKGIPADRELISFATCLQEPESSYPNAQKLLQEGFSLPVYPAMSAADVNNVLKNVCHLAAVAV